MNKITMGEWAEELRNTDKTQGQFRLRNEDESFCCLGILADMIDPDGWEEKPTGLGQPGKKCFRWRNSSLAAFGPDLKTSFSQAEFYQLNDDKGFTFEQIAQHIEDSYDQDMVVNS